MAQPSDWKKIKEIKNDIWTYEQDLTNFNRNLQKVTEQLKLDPENAALAQSQEELEAAIAEFTKEVSDLRAQLPEERPTDSAAAPLKKPKTEIKTGDHVLAYHPLGEQTKDTKMVIAKVISISGGNDNLVYQVRFPKDKYVTQVRANQVRAATKVNEQNEVKKRKQEEEKAISAHTIVAQPQLKKEPSLASAGPDRPAKIPRKLGSEKKLEKGRASWMDFQAKQKTKDSMFRTGDSFNARVGFLGSGRPMTVDNKRTRHVHQEIEED